MSASLVFQSCVRNTTRVELQSKHKFSVSNQIQILNYFRYFKSHTLLRVVPLRGRYHDFTQLKTPCSSGYLSCSGQAPKRTCKKNKPQNSIRQLRTAMKMGKYNYGFSYYLKLKFLVFGVSGDTNGKRLDVNRVTHANKLLLQYLCKLTMI